MAIWSCLSFVVIWGASYFWGAVGYCVVWHVGVEGVDVVFCEFVDERGMGSRVQSAGEFQREFAILCRIEKLPSHVHERHYFPVFQVAQFGEGFDWVDFEATADVDEVVGADAFDDS